MALAPAQLSLLDAPVDQPASGGLERIGGAPLGGQLVRLLELDGWEVAPGLVAFAGEGELAIARKNGFEVHGSNIVEVFKGCASIRGALG